MATKKGTRLRWTSKGMDQAILEVTFTTLRLDTRLRWTSKGMATKKRNKTEVDFKG